MVLSVVSFVDTRLIKQVHGEMNAPFLVTISMFGWTDVEVVLHECRVSMWVF